MKKVSLHYFAKSAAPAKELATALSIPSCCIQVHSFPDGESKVRITPVEGTAIIFLSSDKPNEDLLHIAFAASALRENGASRVVLVIPYLCYMRQDKAFNEGEAVSQKIIGSFLSIYFDRLITVDPHLHRIDDLQEVFPACRADSLSANMLIADVFDPEYNADNALLIGPDSESRQWVSAIAERTNIPFIIAQKIRRDDRDVHISLPKGESPAGKHTIIVDDVISSGMTVIRCAEALVKANAASIEVVATHVLCSDTDLARLRRAGISNVRSSDSIHHSTNNIHLAPLLAQALQEEFGYDS